MRILHVVPTYLPARRYGGPIVAVHGLCKALAARGHEVDVFTTNVDGSETLDVPVATPVNLDGVNVHYFPSTFRRLYISPAMRKALDERVRTYDVVHIHAVYLWTGIAAARAAHNAGVPYVISPRGMLVPELIRQKSRLVKTLWLRLLERRGFARAGGIHFTSQLEAEEAARVGLLPLPSPFVIPNGIDVEPRPDIARDENTLLFLGRVSWKKGLDRVIAALPSMPGVRFVIAGNDDERLTPRLCELAAKHGVADRVEIVGPIYGAAKNELMARATLFVLMSTSENFGNAVLESLAMETPVVLSRDVGLADEVVRAGAGIIGFDDVNELLSDPERRAQMGRNGRMLVESRFAWPRVAQEMEEAYGAL
ncbi:MAG TPA: glycosyltransferase [Thermoanaerobaculia bacterium]|jgi:glycosyltransferase involved in cell wall biosynthesis|nr:glycosyltransferase [Thermoanaerobaculia bacterium]